MEEIWKDIIGYEGYYKVSNMGRILSLHKKSKISRFEKSILKPGRQATGYLTVVLYKDGAKKKSFLVHRLVAEAFIPNPNNYEMINHIDECKTNNCVDNLEWCDVRYNNNYGTARFRQRITQGTPVEQISLDGVSLAKYRSASIAVDILGLDCADNITRVCNKNGKVAYGYKWRFTDNY